MTPVGRALHDRFGDVCRSELQRLRRKTASLSAEHRAEVDALTLEVAQRMALRVDAVLDSADSSELAAVVMRLFAVTAPSLEDTQ